MNDTLGNGSMIRGELLNMAGNGTTAPADITATTPGTTAFHTTIAVFYLFLSIYIVGINLVELIIISRIKITSSTVFIGSLAAADLVTGLFLILPSSIAVIVNRTLATETFFLGAIACDISGLLSNTAMLATLFSVAWITVNRWFALMTPLLYRNCSTAKNAYWLVGVAWAVCTLRSLVPFFFGQRYTYFKSTGGCSYGTSDIFREDQELLYYVLLIVVPFAFCLILLVFCPLHMTLLLSRRQAQGTIKKRDTKGPFRRLANSTSSQNHSVSSAGLARNKSLKTRQAEKDATLTTLLVVCSFVICYSVHYFLIVNYTVYLVTGHSTEFSDTQFYAVEACWLLLTNLNSALNPVIYLFRNTTFKHELFNLKSNLLKYSHHESVSHHVMRDKQTSSFSYQ